MSKANISCPSCQKSNTWTPENPSKPFCSERCKLIDLGAWAAEEHKIPTNEGPQISDEESNND